MAVKVAAKVSLSKDFLAKALLAKTTSLYKNEPKYMGYSYEDVIYPQARMVFGKYNAFYKTNEEFTKYFARDLNNKDPLLLEQIKEGPQETRVPIEQTGQAAAEKTLPVASTPTPAVNLPSIPIARGGFQTSQLPRRVVMQSQLESKANMAGETEVPQAFNKAFANEPGYKTDPTQKPPPEPVRSMASAVNKPPVQTVTVTKEQPLRFRSGLRSSLKTGFSNAGIFAKKNAGGILNSLRGMAGGVSGGVIRSGGDLLARGLNGDFPGKRAFSSRIGEARKFTGNRRTQLAKMGKSKGPLVFGLGILGFMVLVGGIAMISPSSSQVPTSGSTYTNLDYTLPIKNSSITPLDIRDQVKATFPSAKIEYWDQIVKSSAENGFNPALTLALWIEETGASQTTLVANGGGGTPNADGKLSKGHFGCAPWEDQTITESLTCLFKFGANYTDSQFAQFMAAYSGGPANAPFSENQNFPSNIKAWYSKLAPTGTGSIQQISAQAVASCPVINGKILTPSYSASPTKGHCSPSYLAEGRCREDCPGGIGGSRRAKAIDVPTNGQEVKLPTVNRQPVNWLYKLRYEVAAVDGGGSGFVFEAQSGPDTWTLDMLHLAGTDLVLNKTYPSDTKVGKTAIDHVHFTLGKGIKDNMHPGPATTVTDCDPGWIPSDFMCP